MRAQSSQSRHFLVELIINCLFFFIMAAVCLSVFARGHIIQESSHKLSMAVLQAQSTAESFKAAKGDIELFAKLISAQSDENLTVYYDENWALTSEDKAVYSLFVQYENSGNMHKAQIDIKNGDENFYSLNVLCYNENSKGGAQ